ncbi:hypothetical protein PNEG_02505 [Pneumocystis murina B123]|uniref:Large ribosomal subunit protein uL23 N-terminal domain-containing protein n=1 Tax=Pneumocystis murina (strain B123) TaxID=1069680 RepID=M7P5K8_PNEMU|nr:hypothetical protein PNEG_02505 [Pneumocystis murina B123]EMR09165.1 hypothetical protein PNEG_02505 [Pneumocystis murina B123]
MVKKGKISKTSDTTSKETIKSSNPTAKAEKAAKAVALGNHSKLKRRVRTSATFRRPKTLRLSRKPLYLRKSIPHVPRLDEYKILICPMNTESSMKKIEENNTLVFRVNIKANKHQIKKAFKKLYDVDILKVNTLISPNGIKKAYVKLTADMDALDVANKIGFV